ncbi:MAG: hypothetical protein HYS12_01010 [Planctomycetes bacterium]|nr:hypothetical protein [Planctomycetota bacterium]
MMYKKWMGVALLAVGLGQGTGAKAQLPSPGGVPALPEPLPCAPTGGPGPGQGGQCPPNLVPGPLSPSDAPPGPPDTLGLPPEVKNAFPCEEYPPPTHAFFHAGSQALQRQKLGHSITAIFDNSDFSRVDSGNVIFPFSNVRPAQDLNNIVPEMAFGYRGTLGILLEEAGCSLEFTGFYVPQSDATNQITLPGRLSSFFFNAPTGFEGDNGLFLQGDRSLATQQTAVGSAELNVRTFSKAFTGCELLLGVRYLNVHDRFSLFFDDDGLLVHDIFGRSNPTLQATYSSRVNSNIIAPQVGFEYQHSIVHGVAFGMYGKTAAGYDLSDIAVTLTRGDGLLGTNGAHTRHNFSQIYEIGGYFDVYLLERLRLRGGYIGMWVVNVPEAVDQVSFDLAAPLGRQDSTGSIFFHGPSIEFQFLF